MKILLIGASGTIGREVRHQLAERHEVVAAGRSSGEVRLDLTDPASVDAALTAYGPFDAVVSTAGNVAFGNLSQLDESQWTLSLNDKLMGQVRLALSAARHLNAGGSITLTSGLTAQEPVHGGSVASLVNGALEAFARTAALEMPRGIRLNVVSPGSVLESPPGHEEFFRGFELIPVARVALGYVRSVEGGDTGQTYRIH
jgi:NAD(P)-dependent dehydrogenase (short-subunit alcohol dehydrogenase family)